MQLAERSAPRRRRALVAASAAFVVAAASWASPAHAEPDPGGPVTTQVADPCPSPVPTAAIVPGLVGQGMTVVRGDTPQPFTVTVLGLLKDGIGAGRDMVMIEVSDLDGSTVVGDNGIWAGMSGSPVYVDGKLLGAVSYGFTASPSPIGGLTPAADMLALLGSSPARTASAPRTKVTLSTGQRKSLDTRAAAAVPRTTLQRLRTPVSVSGLTSKRLASLQGAFDGAGRSVITYAGGRTSATAVAAAAPVPGGNFAAVLTSGDLSISGVGTTTAVCGSKVLAFGHPMDFAGQVTYGANAATSLAIVKDGTFGSFKMANVGGTFGTVDQDRLAALRATLGRGPATTPITSTITNLDNRRTRTGTTQVAAPDYTAVATAYGLWANYDSTFDKWGKGLATSSWTIRGTRAAGKAFAVSRSNMWSDRSDPTIEPTIEVADAVDAIRSNELEPVKITSVAFKSAVSSAYDQYRITRIAVSVNGGRYKTSSVIKVKPKAKLRVKVTMRGYQSTVDRTVLLNLTVAKRYAKQTGTLTVQGGLDGSSSSDTDPSCLLEACDEPDGSLNSVLAGLTAAPANNAVQADLDFDENAEGEFSTDARTAAKAPVSGEQSIVIKVKKK
ncbi:hypothetical protein GCM10022204_09340 [Microlunatus aurantiacus]|uniref:Peptidase S55 domain-containing protein n=1 Tax=Microlunatus aurantiacus TaxID=446786 RepID=A0ABP7CXB8_9ACTN